MQKSPLHILQIAKNIGMIELQIVQHRNLRRIMNEFTALIKKSAVVLIALNHKGISDRAEVIPHGRIHRHSPN